MKHNWTLQSDGYYFCDRCEAHSTTNEEDGCLGQHELSIRTRDAFEARTDRDLRNEPPTIDDFDATELQDSDSYKEFERKQEQSD